MLCACGRCNQETKLAPKNRKDRGWVKGEPFKFIRGHSGGKVAKEKTPIVPKPATTYPDPGGLYPPRDIEEFVLGLGKWTIKSDPAEYRSLLHQCIEVYGRRKDKVGKLHVEYAMRELAALRK